MTLCPTCTTPLPSADTCCPTCCARARAGRPVSAKAALLVGLLGVQVGGCGDKEEEDDTAVEDTGIDPQPEYGVATSAGEDDQG
jgi:hypothetical protein